MIKIRERNEGKRKKETKKERKKERKLNFRKIPGK